jgi:ABC-2 type transport system permease protein
MTSSTLTSKQLPRTIRRSDTDLTAGGLLSSEWIKFRTLRSSWLTLAGAVLVMIAFGAIFGYATSTANWAKLGAGSRAATGSLGGYLIARIVIGVLGVLLVTGEYATGMIRSTFTAVPRRLPVLAAKSGVFAAIAVLTMTMASFAAYFLAQAFLRSHGHGSSLSEPGALRCVAGLGVYLALIGALGGALGWIMRSTAGGISALVGIMLILPQVVGLLPSGIGDAIIKYVPSEAGDAFINAAHNAGTLSPWTGLGVLTLWVAGAIATATVLIRRRDA